MLACSPPVNLPPPTFPDTPAARVGSSERVNHFRFLVPHEFQGDGVQTRWQKKSCHTWFCQPNSAIRSSAVYISPALSPPISPCLSLPTIVLPALPLHHLPHLPHLSGRRVGEEWRTLWLREQVSGEYGVGRAVDAGDSRKYTSLLSWIFHRLAQGRG